MSSEKTYYIHPTSILDEGVTIGNGTKIWCFTHILSHAQIGNNCNIGQNVMIDKNVMIGNGVKIQNNVSVYTGVIIEDDVFIGPSVVFTNVINPRAFIERKNEFKTIRVRKGASIGANATIVCGVELGKYCLVGAGAVVTKNIIDFALVVGNPAIQIGWISRFGYKLEFNKDGIAYCPQSGDQYILQDEKVIFESK